MDFQTGLVVAFQAAPMDLKNFMGMVSICGIPEFYLVVLPLVLWCIDKKLGLRLILLLSISTVINSALKILFHTPRPYWTSPDVKAMASESTFAMPSGHAQATLIFFGYIGAWFNRINIWIVSILLIMLVGVARIYLGVHYLSDILTGWAAGIILLILILRYEDRLSDWILKRTIRCRILVAFCSSLGLILLTSSVIFSLGTWQIPPGWYTLAIGQTGQAINPVSLQNTLMSAGLLFGAASGAILQAEYHPYCAGGRTDQKIVRFVLGLAILFIIWFALSSLTKSPGISGQVMLYARAAIDGIWITLGAPVLFNKLGIAGSEPSG